MSAISPFWLLADEITYLFYCFSITYSKDRRGTLLIEKNGHSFVRRSAIQTNAATTIAVVTNTLYALPNLLFV
jgi:hypothetical protein